MKKVLLAGTALLGVAFIASPAAAELNLDLGGYFRGYGVYADNDEPGGLGAASFREFEFRRDTEIHFTGETTLDNGLTIGFHNEMNIEANALEDESYAYFSGGWGRVNFGSEDGAAYLLQVAAPSADSNVDGLRQYIDGSLNFFSTAVVGGQAIAGATIGALDYDHADFRQTDRLTYLTPKFNGFQAGASYAPIAGQMAGIAGMTQDNNANQYEDLWEVGARWDGEFSGFGLSVGAGFSTADLESAPAAAVGAVTDGVDTWNVGASLGWNSFTVGAAYLQSSSEQAATVALGAVTSTDDVDVDTWVIGAAWDNGPYHVGLTYLDREVDRSSAVAALDANLEQNRWALGAGYTYGPGMTFRGALALTDNDTSGTGTTGVDNDTTQVTIGTDIQF